MSAVAVVGQSSDTCVNATIRPLSEGLIAYFPFTTNALDASGGNNNGTVYGATLTTDRFGVANRAYNFNGSSAYIELNRGLQLPQNYTVSAWINTNSLNSNWQTVIGKYETNQYGPYWFGLHLDRANAWISNGSGSFTLFDSDRSVAKNRWVHIVWTGRGTVGKMYVNGVLDGTKTMPLMTQNNDLVTIGKQVLWTGIDSYCWFNGSLDDIRLYNRTMSDCEVKDLYDKEKPPVLACVSRLDSGLVAYYPFTGNARDSSRNNNHGTVNGATLTTDRFDRANRAYLFGRNRYIEVPHSNSLAIRNQISMSAWVNIANFDNPDSPLRYAAIMQKSGNQSHGGGDYQFGIPENSTSCGISTDGNYQGVSSTINLPLNQWHHLVYTWDGTVFKIYANKILVISKQVSGIIDNSQKALFIGLDIDGASEWFGGKIDDIRIYNRAMTECEVSDLYNQERPRPPVGTLIACYNLDNNATEPINQLNGQARNVDAAIGRNGVANNALKFRGDTSSYVSLPNNSLLRPDTLSVSFWANLNETASTTQYLFFHRYDVTFNFEAFAITTFLGKFRLSHFPNTNPIDSRTAVQTNRWYHLAGVFRGDSLFFYVDGVLEGAAKSNGLTQYMTGRSFVLGGTNETLYNRPYNGRIDDLRIYSKALTSRDIDGLLKDGSLCGTTALQDIGKQDFSIFPNPTHDKLTINLKNTEGSIKVKATITDIAGRILIQQTIQTPQAELNVSSLLNGLYLITVETSDGLRGVQKLIKN